jgi:hypothetical protein
MINRNRWRLAGPLPIEARPARPRRGARRRRAADAKAKVEKTHGSAKARAEKAKGDAKAKGDKATGAAAAKANEAAGDAKGKVDDAELPGLDAGAEVETGGAAK